MPIKLQVPTLVAISDDVTRDKTYLQTQVDIDPDFVLSGQLMHNRTLGLVYYKDVNNVMQDFTLKNQDLADQTLVQLHQDLVDANLPTITSLAEVVAILTTVRDTLANYTTNRTL